MRPYGLELVSVSKAYGEREVIKHLSLRLPKGALLTLLGPSGCGKTTVLRIVAGFVEPSEGDVLIDDANVTGIIPEKRPTSIMFQSYALFPHMTVFENIAFGLRLRGIGDQETRRRVGEMLDLVDLGGLAERHPAQLSGGQQQRTALARSLVIGPKVLLLDEPFAALDRDLRERMQVELRKLQQELGITMVVVTHDQNEALILSDYVAVMNLGRIEQIDDPSVVYDRPATRFVASFMGIPNVVAATMIADGAGRCVEVGGVRLPVAAGAASGIAPGPVAVALRKEAIAVAPRGTGTAEGAAVFPGTVRFGRRIGGEIALEVDTAMGLVHARVSRKGDVPAPGAEVALSIAPENIVVVPA